MCRWLHCPVATGTSTASRRGFEDIAQLRDHIAKDHLGQGKSDDDSSANASHVNDADTTRVRRVKRRRLEFYRDEEGPGALWKARVIDSCELQDRDPWARGHRRLWFRADTPVVSLVSILIRNSVDQPILIAQHMRLTQSLQLPAMSSIKRPFQLRLWDSPTQLIPRRFPGRR